MKLHFAEISMCSLCSMKIHENSWKLMKFHEISWNFMIFIPPKKCMLYPLQMVMQNDHSQRGGYEERGADLGSTGYSELRSFIE